MGSENPSSSVSECDVTIDGMKKDANSIPELSAENLPPTKERSGKAYLLLFSVSLVMLGFALFGFFYYQFYSNTQDDGTIPTLAPSVPLDEEEMAEVAVPSRKDASISRRTTAIFIASMRPQASWYGNFMPPTNMIRY